VLLQQQGSRVEVARPQVFSGKMVKVSAFINAAHIYIRIKMTEETVMTQVAWVLSYVQGGIAEAWKDNLLDELAKGESEVELVEQLFTKIRNDFGETCHDLAKRLSYYLYFFSFLFFFFFFGLTTTRWSVGKYHVTLSQCHNGVTYGHRWSRHKSQSQGVT